MGKTHPISAAQVQKHYEYLQEMKSLLDKKEKFTMKELAKIHGVDHIASKILVEGGILSKKGHAAYTRFKWQSSDPSPSMARELYRRIKDHRNSYINKYRGNKEGETPEPTKQELQFPAEKEQATEQDKRPSIADKQEQIKAKYAKQAEESRPIKRSDEKEVARPIKRSENLNKPVTVVKKSILWGLYTYEKTIEE